MDFTYIYAQERENTMKMKKIAKEDGITILEVLIAMIIMSVSLLLLLNMGMVALGSNDWSNKTTIATQALQEKLEQLRNVPNLSSADGGSDTTLGLSRTWTVSDAGNHLRQIDVTVAWEDLRGRDKTNSLSAFIKTDSL